MKKTIMIIVYFWVNRYFSSRLLRADNEVVVVGTGPDNCGLDKRCGKKEEKQIAPPTNTRLIPLREKRVNCSKESI